MLPHLGAGAGQALEDAYILSRLLSHPQSTKSNVEVTYVHLCLKELASIFVVGIKGL